MPLTAIQPLVTQALCYEKADAGLTPPYGRINAWLNLATKERKPSVLRLIAIMALLVAYLNKAGFSPSIQACSGSLPSVRQIELPSSFGKGKTMQSLVRFEAQSFTA